jgi:hypothetical protein
MAQLVKTVLELKISTFKTMFSECPNTGNSNTGII